MIRSTPAAWGRAPRTSYRTVTKITSFHVENDTSDAETATFVAFSEAQAARASIINAF